MRKKKQTLNHKSRFFTSLFPFPFSFLFTFYFLLLTSYFLPMHQANAQITPGIISFGGQSLLPAIPCPCSIPSGVPGAYVVICNNATLNIPTPLFISVPPITDVNLSAIVNPATLFIPGIEYLGKYLPVPHMCGIIGIGGACIPNPLTPIPAFGLVSTFGNGGIPSGPPLCLPPVVNAAGAIVSIGAGTAVSSAVGAGVAGAGAGIIGGTGEAGVTSDPFGASADFQTGTTNGSTSITNDPSSNSQSQYSVNAPNANLKPGDNNEQVRQLQQFLNERGYSVSQSGAGSPGNETTYFGPATQRALTNYQNTNGISTGQYAGYYGPATRNQIANSGTGNNIIVNNTSNSSSVSSNKQTNNTSIPKISNNNVNILPRPSLTSLNRSLSQGSSGSDVSRLQALLVNANSGPNARRLGEVLQTTPPGNFGNLTGSALKEYQSNQNLSQTGFLDLNTRNSLTGSTSLSSSDAYRQEYVRATFFDGGDYYTNIGQNITGTGLRRASVGVVGSAAVDPALIPYGSQIVVQTPDGPRYFIADDTGSAVVSREAATDLATQKGLDTSSPEYRAPVVDFYSSEQVGGEWQDVTIIPYQGSNFRQLSSQERQSFYNIVNFTQLYANN